ncbi:hypothetical protein GQ53DRAFT_813468 [Thozetella sp. PMI_491]|nr:hypothetical protein GQ53DRAFT_813468 [Thozetella sp. PMI_491]
MGPPRMPAWLQGRIDKIMKLICVDFELERTPIDFFNKREIFIKTWVIKNMPGEGFILRFDTTKLGLWPKPKIGDSCLVEFDDFVDTELIYNENDQLEAQLSANKVPMPASWRHTVELILPVPPFARYRELRQLLESLNLEGEGDLPENREEAKFTKVKLWLKLSWQTLAAEIASVDRLVALAASKTGIDDPRVHAFKYLIDFKSVFSRCNLLKRFPTLSDKSQVLDPGVRAKIAARMSKLLGDDFQSAAFRALGSIPAGLQIIPGGFGSGKSFFCMLIAAIAQAGTKPVKVLYMIDVNRSLDNAAKEMVKMYKDLGMKCTAIRMRSFPVESRDTEFGKPKELRQQQWEQLSQSQREEKKANRAQRNVNPWPVLPPDHRRYFVEEWNNSRHLRLPTDTINQPPDDYEVLTLDRAAFNHYQQNKADLPGITAAMESLAKKAEDRDHTDWENIDSLERELLQLYDEVIDGAQFVAMTPCATYSYSHHLWSRYGGPDIVILDEAGHCRELSSLIPIACFKKATWFITGDHRQLSPHVDKKCEFELLLRKSLLERATLLNKELVHFNTTFRSYQGLYLLPSKVFYNDSIQETKCQGSPESSYHLLRKLNNMKFGPGIEVKLKVPRLIVYSGSYDSRVQYYNSFHQVWIMTKAREFLADPEFTHVNSTQPGSILIITPYKIAFNNYRKAIQRLPDGLQRRMSTATVDLSKGTSADLVFVDMVAKHGTPFNTDPRRLCAAMTRARQAEIIVMSEHMFERDDHWGSEGLSLYGTGSPLQAIWKFCKDEKDGAIMGMTI